MKPWGWTNFDLETWLNNPWKAFLLVFMNIFLDILSRSCLETVLEQLGTPCFYVRAVQEASDSEPWNLGTCLQSLPILSRVFVSRHPESGGEKSDTNSDRKTQSH